MGVHSEPALRAEDLAPGDRASAAPAGPDLRALRVASASHPDFGPAYAILWREFGPGREMESEAVIRDRLAWDPARPPRPGAALAYDLLALRRGGALVALRDHSAVVRLDARGRPQGPVVVHLSHAWVAPEARGQGLAPWLRALPLHTAHRCAAAAGLPAGAPVVLAAEMEPPEPADPATGVRLRSYERAGFRKVDPAAAPYAQPDFRALEELGGEAPRPVPLSLVVRRVGREAETRMPAAEVAAVVEAIYAVYSVHVPETSLAPLRADAASWTARAEPFRLLLPTA